MLLERRERSDWSGGSTATRELGRRLVAQATVGASLVEVLSPGPRFDPGILLAQQVGLVQVLIAQAAIKTFTQAVLPRRAWLDIQHFHADQGQPGLDRRRDKLGTVVATKSFRHAMHREQFGQRIDRVFARDAAANFDRQALTSVLVNDVQKADRPAVDR